MNDNHLFILYFVIGGILLSIDMRYSVIMGCV